MRSYETLDHKFRDVVPGDYVESRDVVGRCGMVLYTYVENRSYGSYPMCTVVWQDGHVASTHVFNLHVVMRNR